MMDFRMGRWVITSSGFEEYNVSKLPNVCIDYVFDCNGMKVKAKVKHYDRLVNYQVLRLLNESGVSGMTEAQVITKLQCDRPEVLIGLREVAIMGQLNLRELEINGFVSNVREMSKCTN